MRNLLPVGVHVLVLWALTRALVGLATSSGTQSLWAIAGATVVAVALGTGLTAWLTRGLRKSWGALLRRLLPVPVAAATWVGWSAWSFGGTPAQVTVAAGAWCGGAALGLIVAMALKRMDRRDDSERMRATVA